MRYALLLLLVSSRPADACSIACSEPQAIRLISPAPDAGGVPLNAEIKILGTGEVPRVVSADGGAVNVDATVFGGADDKLLRLRPRLGLLANTTYSVLLADGGVHSTFATGSAVDSAAPTFEGITGEESTGYQGGYSCGSPRAFALTLGPASDDLTANDQLFFLGYVGPSAKEISFDKPAFAISGAEEPILGGINACQHNYRLADGEQLSVVLTAVDLAGNESERPKPRDMTEYSACGCGTSAGSALVGMLGMGLALLARRRGARP